MGIKYVNGPGTNIGNAIKIIGAHGEIDGVDAEYELIELIFNIIRKKWTVPVQFLIAVGDRYYDRLEIKDEDDKVSDIFFDITQFFGRY